MRSERLHYVTEALRARILSEARPLSVPVASSTKAAVAPEALDSTTRRLNITR